MHLKQVLSKLGLGVSGDKPLRCSFCGKSQRQVKKLIAGPAVFICDACVALCNDILAGDAAGGAADPSGDENE